jgi:hypothetical protein
MKKDIQNVVPNGWIDNVTVMAKLSKVVFCGI